MTKKKPSQRRKLNPSSGCISSEYSPAGEVVVSNVDLLTEMLLRVPAKSLIRFKCVSKHWQSVISDSEFACNHTRRHTSSLISGLYLYDSWSREEQAVSFSLHGHPIHGHPSLPTLDFLNGVGAGCVTSTPRILYSCNGLVLLRTNTTDYTTRSYIVCNLTTKKYRVLPETDATTALHARFPRLVYDPSKSPHYKVVLLTYSYEHHDDNGLSYEIDIYSSESASWKHMTVTGPPGRPFNRCVLWNGALHWMSKGNVHIQFEVDAEKLKATPMPPKPKIDYFNIGYFGECRGHLLLVQIRLRNSQGFRILEMDKDCCWVVKCRVNLRPIISVFPQMVQTSLTGSFKYSVFCVLCIVIGATEKDLALLLAVPGKVISYNPKRKTLIELHDLPEGSSIRLPRYYDSPDAYQFIESLSPV